MSQQIMVRISSLAKTLETLEKAFDCMIQSGIIAYKTTEEVEAFKKGFSTALDLLRREYGIKGGDPA